ncbi:unnamed protein product [Rotaria socialis]
MNTFYLSILDDKTKYRKNSSKKILKKINVFLKVFVRNDFVKSARSAVGKNETKKHTKIEDKKIERVTRYSLKVQSGEIPPYIPEWQQKAQQKKSQNPSKWTLYYKNTTNPYGRTFKPRIRN